MLALRGGHLNLCPVHHCTHRRLVQRCSPCTEAVFFVFGKHHGIRPSCERKKPYTQTQTPEYQNWLLRVSSVIPRIPIALECRWVVVARQFVAARPSSNERRMVLRHSKLVPEHNKQAIIAYEKDRKMDSVSQTHILGATHAMP